MVATHDDTTIHSPTLVASHHPHAFPLTEMALRQRPAMEALTPHLQTCLCHRSPGEGGLCKFCGCHGEVGQHNGVCTEGDCDGEGALLGCAGCNMAFHRQCMGTIHWGMDSAHNSVAWCLECYEEWEDYGIAAQNLNARGDTEIQYNPAKKRRGES